MTAKDQNKLIDAGFSIIRADYFRLAIKHKSSHSAWSVLEKDFKSKASVERRMKELLKSEKVVEG